MEDSNTRQEGRSKTFQRPNKTTPKTSNLPSKACFSTEKQQIEIKSFYSPLETEENTTDKNNVTIASLQKKIQNRGQVTKLIKRRKTPMAKLKMKNWRGRNY